MAKSLTTAGLQLIQEFEGCELTAYRSHRSETYWTIGWGHYGPDVKEGQTITKAEADELLLEDLQRYVSYVNNKSYCPVTNKLSQNQFDALVSFCYNCGQGNLKELCSCNSISKIGQDLLLYNKSGGEVLAGLTRRRKAEQTLYYSTAPAGQGVSGSTKFAQFLAEAEKHVGEDADWTWKTYGVSDIEWCAAFVTAVAKTVGGLLGKVIVNTAWAQGHARSGVAEGYGKFYKGPSQGGSHKPKAGDLIFFRWQTEARADKYDCDHVGIVISVTKDEVETIEGNTGTYNKYTSSVKKKTYKLTYNCISGYFRPNWDIVGGSGGYLGGGDSNTTLWGDLYDTENTREDMTIREVGYVSSDYKPSIKSSDIKLSVINYTTLLASFVDFLVPEGGTYDDGNTDTSKLSGNAKCAVDYLIGKGLNGAAACGIAGNIYHESSFNTAAVGDSGTSFGICQWHAGRGTMMKSYVGSNWANNLTGQLDFLWSELKGSYSSVLKSLKAVDNTEDGCKVAADVFVRKFEVPANVDEKSIQRQQTAVSYYKKLVKIT